MWYPRVRCPTRTTTGYWYPSNTIPKIPCGSARYCDISWFVGKSSDHILAIYIYIIYINIIYIYVYYIYMCVYYIYMCIIYICVYYIYMYIIYILYIYVYYILYIYICILYIYVYIYIVYIYIRIMIYPYNYAHSVIFYPHCGWFCTLLEQTHPASLAEQHRCHPQHLRRLPS